MADQTAPTAPNTHQPAWHTTPLQYGSTGWTRTAHDTWTTHILLTGPTGERYYLELDPEHTDSLRRDLASGPGNCTCDLTAAADDEPAQQPDEDCPDHGTPLNLTNLQDRIAQAALHAVEAALGDTLTPSAREEALAGIAAVLPALADQPAERRERYRHAITEAEGFQFESCEPMDYLHAADAVMAVADAEQASLRAEAEGLDEALRGLISASEKDNSRLRADRAAVLREEAARIRAHCPDHLDSNSATGAWMVCHCAVADDIDRRIADEVQQEASRG